MANDQLDAMTLDLSHAVTAPTGAAVAKSEADSPRMIVLEFNELCPSLLRRFMDEGRLPHFKALYESSTVYTTDAGEQPPNLEPWIQWFTLHSGEPYDRHHVYHLGDGRRFEGKLMAQRLSEAGVRVGVFGSMNTNYRQLDGYYIPDPWDVEAKAWPAWLAPFYDTVARQVQESSRRDAFKAGDMARFGLFVLRHGLRPGTAWQAVRQLLDERRNRGLHWRRACLLDHLSYDVFRWLNRRLKVQFATFFANSTAHLQHYHWRNMEPQRFRIPPEANDDPSLATAVRYGYESMDRLIGKVLKDYPSSLIVLATGLSQQPWDTTKCTYRPRDFQSLLDFAGVTDRGEVKPVMAEQFHVLFADAAAAQRGAQALKSLSVRGQPLMNVTVEGEGLFCGCGIMEYGYLQDNVSNSSGQSRRFDALLYMIHGLRSGRHHPDGVFWVRNHRHEVVQPRLPLTAVAPAVLRAFGLAASAAPHRAESEEALRQAA